MPVLPQTIEKNYTSTVVQHSANGLEYLGLIIIYSFNKRKYFDRDQFAVINKISIVVIEKLRAAKTAKLRIPAVFDLSYQFINSLLVNFSLF